MLLAILIITLFIHTAGFIMRPYDTRIIQQIGYNDCKNCKHFQKDEEYGGRCALFHYTIEEISGNKKKIYKDTISVRSWECIDGLYYSEVKNSNNKNSVDLDKLINNMKDCDNDDWHDDDCELV